MAVCGQHPTTDEARRFISHCHTARRIRTDDNRTYPYGRGDGLRLFTHARHKSQVAPARRLSFVDVFRSICRSPIAEALAGSPARCLGHSDCFLFAGASPPRGNAARGRIARSAKLTVKRIGSKRMNGVSRDPGAQSQAGRFSFLNSAANRESLCKFLKKGFTFVEIKPLSR